MSNDVQFLAAAVNEKRRKLYRADSTPIYAADVMREKLAEIDAYERDGLTGIIATHTERMEWAEGVLAEKGNAYSWLHGDEWGQAAAMSSFIAADIAVLPDAKALAAYVDTAAGAGRVQNWLAHWHGVRRLGNFEHDIFRPQAGKALEAAADKLMTLSDRDMKRKAAEDLQDARQQIHAATDVLKAPQVADRLGVPGYVAEVRQREGFDE